MPQTPAPFPASRPRRLRRSPWIRDLTRENEVTVKDLIWPIFVRDGRNVAEPGNAIEAPFCTAKARKRCLRR